LQKKIIGQRKLNLKNRSGISLKLIIKTIGTEIEKEREKGKKEGRERETV
jgi:hypothetical protein